MTEFRNHGEFKIVVDGDIITSELTGPWNIETARDFMVQLMTVAARQMKGQPWASLVVCKESILFPLEMIAPLRAGIATRVVEFNQVAVAMVITPEVEGYGVLDGRIRSIYEGLIPFEVFGRVEDAVAWFRKFLTKPV